MATTPIRERPAPPLSGPDRERAGPTLPPRRAWAVVGLALAGGVLASFGVTVPLLRPLGALTAVAAAWVAPNGRVAALGGFLATAVAATGSDRSADGSAGRLAVVLAAGAAGAAVAALVARRDRFRRPAAVGVALVVLAAGALPGPSLPATGPSAGEVAGGRLDPAVADRLDSWLRDEVSARRMPGAAVSVVRRDGVVFERGYGVAGPDRRPLTPDTPVLLASVSKSFAGLAVAQLVHQGRLDLSRPVRDYLPDFTLADPAAAARLTVGDVLDQRSGLGTVDGINAVGRDELTLAEAVDRMARIEPVRDPGTDYEYSNLNFQIAGRLVEVASGLDYATYLRRHVLDPLGMHHTTAQVDASVDGLERADGYATVFGLASRVHDRPVPVSGVAAGGVSASAADLGRYLRAHLGGGVIDGGAVLAPEVVRLLHEAPADAYVDDGRVYHMGWVLVDDEDGRRIEHGGAWTNTSTGVVMFPDEDLGIAVVAPHMALANAPASRLRAGVEAILAGEDPPAAGRAYALGYAVVDLVTVLLIALVVRAASGVPRWRDRSARPLGARIAWVLASHLVVPIAVLAGFPALYGVPWSLQARFLPDLVVLIVVAAAVLLGTGMLKLGQLAVSRQSAAVPAGARP